MTHRNLLLGAIVTLGILLPLGGLATTYNSLVSLEQDVDAQWAQVENAYQRRTDLVPSLVAVVKGAAAHERGTLEAVITARAKIGRFTGDVAADPATLREFQAAQDHLSSALTRLIAVSEAYPTLRANENFMALQAQLEGTENRIAVERQRFNEAARTFNTRRSSFPAVMFVGVFGDRFASRPYFNAVAGAERAPQIEL